MANWYADFDLVTTGSAGTQLDPFSWADLRAHYIANTDPNSTIYCKGTKVVAFAEFIDYVRPGYTILPWELGTPGPFRLQADYSFSGENLIDAGTIRGAIFNAGNQDNHTIEWWDYSGEDRYFYSCVFDVTRAGSSFWGQINSGGSATFKGCIFVARNAVGAGNAFNFWSQTAPQPWLFEDCVFLFENSSTRVAAYNSTVTMRNCYVSSMDRATFISNFGGAATLTDTDCVYSQPYINIPDWDDTTKSNWYYTTLFGSIPEPPNPGYGSPDYAEYDTGLWGYPRFGIGTGLFDNPPSIVSFSGYPTTTGEAPLSVEFIYDASYFGTLSASWEFGDGGTSIGVDSPTHVYTTPGVYSVTLTITDEFGSDAVTNVDYITVTGSVAPEADFTATPLTGTSPLSVTFTDTSTGDPTSWSWDFGDTGTSTEQNPTYVYPFPGTYTVSLTATNAEGSDTETKSSYITVTSSLSYVLAKFIAKPQAGVYPFKVNFTSLSVNADTFAWDFGDGDTSTEENPFHYYDATGQYNVTLTASNSQGSDSITKTSYVYSFDNKFSLNEHYAGTSAVVVPYKTCTEFLTIGWIKSPTYQNGEYIVPLAVEDNSGNVLDSDESLKFMLLKEAGDYKFVFNNSESQLIKKSIGIDLEDDQWHFLRWACTDSDGTMRYSVDNVIVPLREGSDSEGLEYSIAYNRAGRIGGGDVWCPYIYDAGQSITLYNWRFGLGFALTDSWVKDLMDIDKEYLGI